MMTLWSEILLQDALLVSKSCPHGFVTAKPAFSRSSDDDDGVLIERSLGSPVDIFPYPFDVITLGWISFGRFKKITHGGALTSAGTCSAASHGIPGCSAREVLVPTSTPSQILSLRPLMN